MSIWNSLHLQILLPYLTQFLIISMPFGLFPIWYFPTIFLDQIDKCECRSETITKRINIFHIPFIALTWVHSNKYNINAEHTKAVGLSFCYTSVCCERMSCCFGLIEKQMGPCTNSKSWCRFLLLLEASNKHWFVVQ